MYALEDCIIYSMTCTFWLAFILVQVHSWDFVVILCYVVYTCDYSHMYRMCLGELINPLSKYFIKPVFIHCLASVHRIPDIIVYDLDCLKLS